MIVFLHRSRLQRFKILADGTAGLRRIPDAAYRSHAVAARANDFGDVLRGDPANGHDRNAHRLHATLYQFHATRLRARMRGRGVNRAQKEKIGAVPLGGGSLLGRVNGNANGTIHQMPCRRRPEGALAQLHTGRAGGKGNIDAIIHEELNTGSIGVRHESLAQVEQPARSGCVAAQMECQVGSASFEHGPRSGKESGRSQNGVIRDDVKFGQHQ
jgi:hypothetical protein